MKRHLKRSVVFLILLSLLIQTAFAVGAGDSVYINKQQIADNLNYINTVSWNSAYGREESFKLELDGAGDAYPIVMACDTIYGSMTISKMISYAESCGKNVLAAVNTDFFSTTTGVPDGIVIENGIYKSSAEGNTAVAFTSGGDVIISENPAVTMTLTNNGSSTNSANCGKTVTVSHFNKYRTDTGGLYMFSSAFSTVSTRTSSNGWFVKFKILEGEMTVSGDMTVEVVETISQDGAITIGDGYLVLSAATSGGWGSQYSKFSVGDVVTLNTSCSDVNLTSAQYATGGGDILISEGAITDSGSWDSTIDDQNPRTAIGVKADGTLVCYVIDGRSSEYSNGISLSELAEELKSQGCIYAVNFDGGGSSAMSIRLPGDESCSVVNSPSDGALRKCATYILFVIDAASSGTAENLSLDNDGIIVLAGSRTSLAYAATDSGYRPASVPADLRAVSAGFGTVSGTTYTAGQNAGTDMLMLSSASTGASGMGSVHVIKNLTSVKVTKQGSSTALTSLSVSPGDTIKLTSAANYYGRKVEANAEAFSYSVTGDIGTISNTGLYTVGTTSDITGTIKVCVGNVSAVINVRISGFSDTVNHWAKEYIDALTDEGIVNGITATTFEPESNIKRGDFVLMLYRAAGNPTVSGAASFTDVSASDYYALAVAWAEASGIAQGTGSGQFEPQASLTREQAFTFVYRALNALKVSYINGTSSDLSGFSDLEALSDYAVTPTATLVKMGVVSGSGGVLDPGNHLTRAQMAKILSSAMGLV